MIGRFQTAILQPTPHPCAAVPLSHRPTVLLLEIVQQQHGNSTRAVDTRLGSDANLVILATAGPKYK